VGDFAFEEIVVSRFIHAEGTLLAQHSIKTIVHACGSRHLGEGSSCLSVEPFLGFVVSISFVVCLVGSVSQERGKLNFAGVDLVVPPGVSRAEALNAVSGLKEFSVVFVESIIRE